MKKQELLERIEILENEKTEINRKVAYLWDFIHNLAKDVNNNRLVLRKYQRENQLTDVRILEPNMWAIDCIGTGTGIEYLNNQIKVE